MPSVEQVSTHQHLLTLAIKVTNNLMNGWRLLGKVYVLIQEDLILRVLLVCLLCFTINMEHAVYFQHLNLLSSRGSRSMSPARWVGWRILSVRMHIGPLILSRAGKVLPFKLVILMLKEGWYWLTV
jgi:hypothetical protein